MLDEKIMGELDAMARLHAMPPTVPVSTEVAAAFLGYSVGSLENMRRDGTGPLYIQPPGEGSKKVKYQIGALLDWMGKNQVSSIVEAAIRDGKLFTTLEHVNEKQPFWIDAAGMIEGPFAESTAAEAAALIKTHEIEWLTSLETVTGRGWSDIVAHAMLAGFVTAALKKTVGSIDSRVEATTLRDMINEPPATPRKSIDD